MSILLEHPTCHVTAIDIDKHAVDLATHNAKLYDLPFSRPVHASSNHLFRHAVADRLRVEHVSASEFHAKEPFDVVVSNPPYIPTACIVQLQPEVQRCPKHVSLAMV